MGATPRLTNRKVPTSPDCHRGTPSNAECYPCNQSLPTPESTYLCDASLSSSRGIQEAAYTTSTSHSFILDVVSWLHRTFLHASTASLSPTPPPHTRLGSTTSLQCLPNLLASYGNMPIQPPRPCGRLCKPRIGSED